jgi:hypothetical protein
VALAGPRVNQRQVGNGEFLLERYRSAPPLRFFKTRIEPEQRWRGGASFAKRRTDSARPLVN